jgi:hypothetical protein
MAHQLLDRIRDHLAETANPLATPMRLRRDPGYVAAAITTGVSLT